MFCTYVMHANNVTYICLCVYKLKLTVLYTSRHDEAYLYSSDNIWLVGVKLCLICPLNGELDVLKIIESKAQNDNFTSCVGPQCRLHILPRLWYC